MCGGFTCSKNALTALNILYIMVAFILIGVAAYGQAASVVMNLPIIGGILACGILLIMISILGLIGAVKHHQVMLFFYMVILFLLFLIQFSIACAALAVNSTQQERLAQQGWNRSETVRQTVQKSFSCCGFDSHSNSTACNAIELGCCAPGSQPDCHCDPCLYKIQSTMDHAFKLCGGIGLFFSFTEVLAVIITHRYRNQCDPLEKQAHAIFPRNNYLY
uniref:Putative tetraspanin-13 isoform x1 acromyrmex echinatior n=1 Tax=Xenopsylla cheopis TaxID=163159 RepID=A0A6M2DZK9_XENCH